jgi:hypothetical protein
MEVTMKKLRIVPDICDMSAFLLQKKTNCVTVKFGCKRLDANIFNILRIVSPKTTRNQHPYWPSIKNLFLGSLDLVYS